MLSGKYLLAMAVGSGAAAAMVRAASQIGDVFVISMENHNWTQPNGNVSNNGNVEQIAGNPSAPFINSLVNGTATASAQTSYTSTYYNATANEANVQFVHPSELNYIWSEAGSSFGVTNDNPPYTSTGNPQNVQSTTQHLCGLLQSANISWKAYEEDTDINTTTGAVLPQSQWTVPLFPTSGTISGVNAYNGSNQYSYMVQHDPQIFFTDTSGGYNTGNSNSEVSHYAPLQQLQTDLANNTVARYNWITPDEFNCMHTPLPNGFTYHGTHLTGDSAQIAQGDNFLSIVIPEIMSSAAYRNNGMIVLWMDETEPDGNGDNQDDLNHTLPEIVISPLAHANVGGVPYDSTIAEYTHSSDLLTMQEIFQLPGQTSSGALGDAANATSLADLFQPGVIPSSIITVQPITWTNAGGNKLWDIGASFNWNNGSSNTVFEAGDAVTFNDSNGGGYAVTLNTTVSPGTVTVNNGSGDYTIGGTGGIAGTASLAKFAGRTLTLDTVNTYSGGTTVSAGKLIVGVTGALPDGNVTVTGGTLQLGANTGLAQMTSLVESGSGVLDVNNNHVIITGDPVSTIYTYLQAGYNGGHWNGTGGIDTSAPLTVNGLQYGLGFAESGDAHAPGGLSSGQVEVKYTLLGDVYLEGTVNGPDLAVLAANYNQSFTAWDQGNFQYDGIVNGPDLAELAANFNQGDSGADVSAGDVAALDAFAAANGVSLAANVPEPTTVELIALAGTGLLTRRRRGRPTFVDIFEKTAAIP
ncbi:MAG: PEP-CTERM sorting domain-containing protein [Tepidisphaeraceae bacterium]|jgi:autotransporter-associated beta strand protein